jgi:dihydrofolate reductase
MRRIIVSALMTVDGLVSGPDEQISWVDDLLDDEMISEIRQQLHNVDTLLLGRITYELLRRICNDPVQVKKQPGITHYLNRVTKIVFSRTLDQAGWKNTILLRELDRKTIRELQKQDGGDIAVLGSTTIAQTLINLELVNEYQFFVHPLMLGKGKPLFSQIRHPQALTPVHTHTYMSGVLRLSYRALNG